MEATRKPVEPSPAVSETVRLELAIQSVECAQHAIHQLAEQRRLVASATMAILATLSIVTVSFTGFGPVSWLAVTSMACVALLARIAMIEDIDRDRARREEKLAGRVNELRLRIEDADRALDPDGTSRVDA